MSTVNEYHTYARDCLRWAARARTEEQRRQFLTLAHDWTQSALGLEGVTVPTQSNDDFPAQSLNSTWRTQEVCHVGSDTIAPRFWCVPAAWFGE